MFFDAIIVETVLPDWPLLNEQTRQEVYAAVTKHVGRAISAAPAHVRLGVFVIGVSLAIILKLIFVGASTRYERRLRADRLFQLLHKIPGPAASVVRLYRSVSVLAFYEHSAVAPLLLRTCLK